MGAHGGITEYYFRTAKLDKIELARERLRAHEGIPLFEIRFGKLGTEYRCRGSHAVTDKSTASSNQANRTKAPWQRAHFHQVLMKVRSVAIDSAADCLWKRLGGSNCTLTEV